MRPLDEIVRHADRVKGYMFANELRWLAETAHALPAPAAWCEIGSWQGRSATAVCGALAPGSTLTLVDNFSGPTTREMPDKAACQRTLERAMDSMRAWSPGVTVTLQVGESDVVAATMPREFYDVVFIDGDHKYAKVVADIRAWTPTLKAGGLL